MQFIILNYCVIILRTYYLNKNWESSQEHCVHENEMIHKKLSRKVLEWSNNSDYGIKVLEILEIFSKRFIIKSFCKSHKGYLFVKKKQFIMKVKKMSLLVYI